MSRDCLVLWGMPGSGKTSVGRVCADLLGWRFVDLDEEIVRSAGRSIAEIFTLEGETAFRARERECLRQYLGKGVVLSVGGGTLRDKTLREEISSQSSVVVLQASCEEICRRLAKTRESRPLLATGDLSEKVATLWKERAEAYESVSSQVATDNVSIAQVAQRVLSAIFPEKSWMIRLTTQSHLYVLGTGVLSRTGEHLQELGASGTVYVCSDRKVWKHHGAQLRASLQKVGLGVSHLALPAGEACKTQQWLWKILTWLSQNRAERTSFLLGFGGGATTDLVGLAASLYMRGMNLVLLPTTSLGMLDASIGGKTAINSANTKNIYGSFYAPRLVLADTCTLRSLPKRELRASLAEAVKCALINDTTLFSFLFENAEMLYDTAPLSHTSWREVISRSAKCKSVIVEEDPSEQGRRRLLNLGHTLGHAIELLSGIRHGEAVSIGLHASLWLSARRECCEDDLLIQSKTLLQKLGLPVVLSNSKLSWKQILKILQKDKKKVHGKLRFLLPIRVGEVQEVQDITSEELEEVVKFLLTNRA